MNRLQVITILGNPNLKEFLGTLPGPTLVHGHLGTFWAHPNAGYGKGTALPFLTLLFLPRLNFLPSQSVT